MDLDSGNPDFASAMDAAMRWLEVRGRSRAQIEARLRQAGFEPDIAEGVGARLTELGILSDRAFALAGVETGLRRGLARPYLQHQLERRGVREEDAAWALEESGNQASDADRALRLAEAWAKTHLALAAETGGRAFRRLGGMLVRKGYDEELVGEVCRAVLGEPADVDSGLDEEARLDMGASPGAGEVGVAGEPASIDPPWGRS